MHTILCRERQTLEIGEDITITVVEIAPGVVRFDVEAPGKRVTRVEPISLPDGASELSLVYRRGLLPWPPGAFEGKK